MGHKDRWLGGEEGEVAPKNLRGADLREHVVSAQLKVIQSKEGTVYC